jgi:hypothetical protein
MLDAACRPVFGSGLIPPQEIEHPASRIATYPARRKNPPRVHVT